MTICRRILAALLFLCTLAVAAPAPPVDTADPAHRDFIEYWVAGRLLAAHSNPYDRTSIGHLERSNGWVGETALVARNPPWALWFMLPLCLTGVTAGWVLWMSLSVAAFLVSIRICWFIYGVGELRLKSLFLLWAVAFAPVLACLMAAQVGLFLLLGFVLFLHWEKKRPFLAGAALLLPLAKPHLLLPLFLILAFWTVRNCRWRLASGFLVALAAASLLALYFDHQVFGDYVRCMHAEGVAGEFIPSLSGTFRALFFPRLLWVQFIPLALGLIWTAWFYWKTAAWDWRRHGLTLALVSLAVTPYSFFTDDCLALPVVLLAAAQIERASKAGRKLPSRAWYLLALSAVLLFMVMGGVPLTSGFYFWSVLLWSAWRLAASSSWPLVPSSQAPAFSTPDKGYYPAPNATISTLFRFKPYRPEALAHVFQIFVLTPFQLILSVGLDQLLIDVVRL